MAAALREAGEVPSTSVASHRRSLPTKKVLETPPASVTSGLGSYLTGPTNEESGSVRRKDSGNTNADGQTEKSATKNRSRRASEGAHLFRGEGKRVSGELRCDNCGKGYKHSSCLTKHMWVLPFLRDALSFQAQLLASPRQKTTLKYILDIKSILTTCFDAS
jgi:hypothetical protein